VTELFKRVTKDWRTLDHKFEKEGWKNPEWKFSSIEEHYTYHRDIQEELKKSKSSNKLK